MYHFYANILKVILSKKTGIDEMIAYLKTGLPVLFVLSLCFVFQPSLQAQEVVGRRPSNVKFKSNNGRITNGGTVMYFDLPTQSTDTNKKLYYFALKNNLLYDIALLPNITAEVYLGKQLSLAIEGNLSWWALEKTMRSGWFHRIQSAGAELRYWFDSPQPLHGHAVGFYSMIGNYDVRLSSKDENSKGTLSYASWSAGFSYAYSMPIVDRVNLEFGLAIGYLGGKYYDYNYCVMHERWERRAEYNRTYFGPTRVGISVVWLLGNGYSKR